MQSFRRFISNNGVLAGAFMALVLAMKLLVPAGFMPTFSHGRIVMTLCSGTGVTTIVMPMPGTEHGKPSDSQHGKGDQPCAFGGLTAPYLGAVDPVRLALAILFVMSMALRPMVERIAFERSFLRPPLRGPPASL